MPINRITYYIKSNNYKSYNNIYLLTSIQHHLVVVVVSNLYLTVNNEQQSARGFQQGLHPQQISYTGYGSVQQQQGSGDTTTTTATVS